VEKSQLEENSSRRPCPRKRAPERAEGKKDERRGMKKNRVSLFTTLSATKNDKKGAFTPDLLLLI
jgi:hypothetical protein